MLLTVGLDDTQAFLGTQGMGAPWATVSQIAGIMMLLGFSIRAAKIYSDATKSDSTTGVIQGFMWLMFGLIFYGICTYITTSLI